MTKNAGDVVGGHWRIDRLIVTEAVQHAYAATHVEDGRRVVLKVMRPDVGPQARTRFLQESRDPATYEGARVTAVVESGTEGALPFVAMTLPDGPAARPAAAPTGGAYAETVAMPPSAPASGQPAGYVATVAMAPEPSTADEIRAAQEAARALAGMKAARTPSVAPQKRRSPLPLLLIALVVVGGAFFAWWRFLRH